MGWSYEVAQLGNSKMMQVRWHVADTNEDDQLTQDEEINLALADAGGNVYRAASSVCAAIALKYGREMDSKGETQFLAKEKFDQYNRMAKEFAEKARTTGVVQLFSGGNSSRQPAFTTDLHTEPVTTATAASDVISDE